jgi:hypothetical protein
MGEVKDNDYEEELVDFEDDDTKAPDSASARPLADTAKKLVSFLFFFGIFFSFVFLSFGYVFVVSRDRKQERKYKTQVWICLKLYIEV